jgi:hypothetical protein
VVGVATEASGGDFARKTKCRLKSLSRAFVHANIPALPFRGLVVEVKVE